MANGLWASALLSMGKATLDLDLIDLRFFAVSSAYTFTAGHDMLNDITNIISDVVAATGEAIAGISGGFNFDCNDFTLTNVTGAAAAIVGYDHNGGADSARQLVTWHNSGGNLPTGTLAAGSIVVTVNASGVFTVTSSPS